jgi:hypothetical protein
MKHKIINLSDTQNYQHQWNTKLSNLVKHKIIRLSDTKLSTSMKQNYQPQ